MTTQISTDPTVNNAFATAPLSTSRVASPTDFSQANSHEDSVQLSTTAQQYLSASKVDSTTNNNALAMVKQLVVAAAAGDVGALSLLTVA